MALTTINDIKNVADGTEVSIPGFTPDTVINVILKRPSLLDLATHGKIPNPLMATASAMFTAGAVETAKNTGKDFKDFADIVDIMVAESLVKPSAADLKSYDIMLTDTQKIYIYNYAVSGVDSLKPFREQQERDKTVKPRKSAKA